MIELIIAFLILGLLGNDTLQLTTPPKRKTIKVRSLRFVLLLVIQCLIRRCDMVTSKATGLKTL